MINFKNSECYAVMGKEQALVNLRFKNKWWKGFNTSFKMLLDKSVVSVACMP